jgi:hypothetical protein
MSTPHISKEHKMLTRIFLMLVFMLLAASLAFGQTTVTKEKTLTDEAKKIETPVPETPDKPVTPDGPIVLLSPNGKEVWNEGTIQTVEWRVRAKVQVDSVQIRLIEDVGKKEVEPRIIDLAVLKGNPEKWVWEGVAPPMERCKIEVHAFAPEKILLVDESDAAFTIPRDLTPIDDPKQDKDSKESKQAPVPEKQK